MSTWANCWPSKLGRDYTFLHPEVLADRCVIQGNRLVLPNRIHPARFSVLVLPGHKTIHWSSLQKIQAFYEQGGCVIATGQLPSKSAEFGHDEDVVAAVTAMFGETNSATTGPLWRSGAMTGAAVRSGSSTLNAASLRAALDAAQTDFDVTLRAG